MRCASRFVRCAKLAMPCLFVAFLCVRDAAATESGDRRAAAGKATESASTADSAEIDRFLEAWSRQLGDLDSLELRFRQEKKLKILRRPLVSKGKIRLVKGRLLCEVFDRDGKLQSALSIRKGVLKLYYPKLKRLEIVKLGDSNAPMAAFPVFGTDPAAMKRDFHLSLKEVSPKGASPSDAGPSDAGPSDAGKPRYQLTLTPKTPGASLRTMRLHFEGHEVREVEQVDKNGDRVRMIIEAFVRSAEIDPADLEIRVAPGTVEVWPTRRGAPKEGDKAVPGKQNPG